MTSFKQKTYLKEYAINQKMYLYKKNNESTHHINDKNINENFPIDLLNKHNSKYGKYYNNNKNMNNIMNNNYINNNNKNINTSINSNNKSINMNKKPFNKNAGNKNNNNFIYYNSKNK